jgi:hypothetical protein
MNRREFIQSSVLTALAATERHSVTSETDSDGCPVCGEPAVEGPFFRMRPEDDLLHHRMRERVDVLSYTDYCVGQTYSLGSNGASCGSCTAVYMHE